MELKISWEDLVLWFVIPKYPFCEICTTSEVLLHQSENKKLCSILLCLLSFQMELIIIFRISVSYKFTTKVTPYQINSADRWWIDLLIIAVFTENKMLSMCMLCVEKWGGNSRFNTSHLKSHWKKTNLGRNVSFILFKIRKNDNCISISQREPSSCNSRTFFVS